MNSSTIRSTATVTLVIVTAAALAGCSTGASTNTPVASAAAGAVDLSAVCPSNIVIQTDWDPEAENAPLYQLLGPNPTIDSSKKIVSGDLYSNGAPTGVSVELRAGGPAIGYQTVSSVMYQDTSINLGFVATDEAVQLSDKLPTTAIFAPLDIGPQMIMWDPATYPDVTDIKSLGVALKANGGVVRSFGGAAYMDYLTGAGILDPSLVDNSYDGTPAAFVAAGGKDAQQGFASSEPYTYEHEVPAWNKPVDFQLTNEVGYPNYPSVVSVRNGDLDGLSPCLEKLVPVLQQADVDYFASPAATNTLLLDLVTAYNDGWIYTQGVADYAVDEMKKLKLAGNGDNAYIGDLDPARVQKVIDITTPIYTTGGSAPKAGLTASDIFTNQFIDQTIGF